MTRHVHGRRELSLLLSTLTLVALVGCAARPPARLFSGLPQRVKPGHTVFVLDDTGSETKGTVISVSASELTLDVEGVRRPMNPASVRTVERYGDSLWNGTLIGLAFGGANMIMSDEPRQGSDSQVGQRVIVVAAWGAIGAGIDALIRRRDQVYLAPGQSSRSARRITVSPQLGSSGAGVFVMVDWQSRPVRVKPR